MSLALALFVLLLPSVSSFLLPQLQKNHGIALSIKQQHSFTKIRLQAIKVNGDSSSSTTKNKVIPFIVEELDYASRQDCEEISKLVVGVFFEEEAEKLESERNQGPITPWKSMQLAYLKNMQYGDVKGRKFVLPKTISNTMFVAREIVAANGDEEEEPLIDDIKSVYNVKYLDLNSKYKRGQVLGFVDVTEKNFGIATGENEDGAIIGFGDETELEDGSSTPLRAKSNAKRPLRPVLTNLSVKEEARGSGVGSKLVEACEEVVMSSWQRKYFEMVLEVEKSNTAAQSFYDKRGYKALFADPTSRRFDTAGVFLRKVRTTKICYKKDLRLQRAKSATAGGKEGSLFDDIQKLGETLLSSLKW